MFFKIMMGSLTRLGRSIAGQGARRGKRGGMV